ncbi:MAG: hypothetical protein FWF92_04385 [Oscillospiraceae bacterium]|nr:hypothetical protein [Oscillospiraceae bacterium]
MNNNGTVTECSYDTNGNRSSMVYANGTNTDYTYNLANMVKSVSNKKSGTVLSSYSYTYQLDGNQTGKTDNTGKVTSYVYDGLGRLTSESDTTGFSLVYEYDRSSNRTQMTCNDGTVTAYSYDKNNRLLSTIETLGATTTTSNYSYDANGNTIAKMSEVSEPAGSGSPGGGLSETSSYAEFYEYDLLNRMVYSNAQGVEAAYKYRPDGLRFSKTSSGVETIHLWDGATIVGDMKNGIVSATYIRGIGLIAAKSGGIFTYYLFNGHGDTVQLANASGTVTTSYDYDAFGNERGHDLLSWRYDGTDFDSSSGLYTDDFTAYFYNAAKYYMNRPDTGEYVEVLELTPTPAQAFAQWTWMQLSTDEIYVIEFDYWGDIAGTEFVFGLYAGYTGVWLDSGSVECGTGVRHARVELSSSSVDMANAGVFLAYYQDSGSVYITNVRFYNEATVSDANPFRYCGEYYDSETSTLYLRARYYDPRTGRFTQEDPVGSGLNWYTYCNANPILFIDPWGLDSYVFYDPNDDINLTNLAPFVTKDKAELLAKELKELYGTDVHVIAIQGYYYIDGTGEIKYMTAAEFFEQQWNEMGSNDNPIDCVALYFHGRSTADGIAFRNPDGSTDKWNSKFTDVTKLNVKSMDTILLISCEQAKGSSNFATDMVNRMNTNYLIATSGEAKTWRPLGLGSFQFRTSTSWTVYQKHYPMNDSDMMVQGATTVTKKTIGKHYSGVKALFKAAGIT